jgi:hypothetical protein
VKKLLLPLALLLSYKGMGQQWDIGGGPSIGAPLIYNQYVGSNHHAAPSFNAEFIARYLPANLSFYPQLNVSIGGSEVPVLKIDELVINMFLMQIEATLSARIVYKIDEKREFHYGMGLGGIYYQSEGVSVALKGNQNAYSGSTRQDINGWLPTVNVGGEFITRISSKKPVYCGIGGRLGYTYFANTTETIDAGISSGTAPGSQINVGPKGNMITPVLHLSFYYRFGERYY